MTSTPSDALSNASLQPMSQPSSPDSGDRLKQLRDRLTSGSEKQQLDALRELETPTRDEIEILTDFLSKRQNQVPTDLDGKAYQILVCSDLPQAQAFLENTFPNGRVNAQSERSIDYQPLQACLIQRDYETADRLTLQNLCELAGAAAIQRKWLYFSEVNNFPITDLQTIDTLWRIYSEGKFGFSVQRDLWLSVGQNWDRLWPKIGWRTGSNWTRYPSEFIWDVSAPRGHLPLTNQLRGVRVMESLMKHPAWD